MLIVFRLNCILAAVVIGGILWLGAGIAQYSALQEQKELQTLNYLFSFLVIGGNVILFIGSFNRSYPAVFTLFKLTLGYSAMVIASFVLLSIFAEAQVDFQILTLIACLTLFKIALSFGALAMSSP